MKILFVCTGNTCRSPMAEALAKKFFPQFDIRSAGISVIPGSKVSNFSINAMQEFNIDISNHIPCQLSKMDVDNADIIIPMTIEQMHFLINLGIDKTKIKMFEDEIPDPYRMPLEYYQKCAYSLKLNIEKLLGELNAD